MGVAGGDTMTMSSLSWQDLNTISQEHGSDFYLINMEKLAGNLRAFTQAFTRHVPNTRPAYSVKTNYLPVFVKEAAAQGWYNEVVSGFEYDLVRSLGVPGEDIIFNGPIKTDAEIGKAVGLGSLLNVDSLSELERIAGLVGAGHPARIALRCNLEIATPTRFGIAVNDPSFKAALALCRESDALSLEGLHCHYCHPGKTPRAYTGQAEALLALIEAEGLAGELKHINMGGGFFSAMPEEMARQFAAPVPSVDEYAQAICAPLSDFLQAHEITLILEPGLVVVADVMDFVTTVYDLKPVAGGQTEVIVTGGVYNVKPGKSKLNMPFHAVTQSRRNGSVTARISGFTCMEDDVLHSEAELAAERGDFLVFQNCGAYTNVLKPPFIRLAPPILAVGQDSAPALVARREVLADITQRFV